MTTTAPPQTEPPLGRYWPLWMRIVFFSVLLMLLVQVIGWAVIRSTIDTNARKALSAELQVGAKVWTQLLDQRAASLRQAASVLSSEFAFREALASGDRDTVLSALENHSARIGAELSVVFDTRFQPRESMLRGGAAQLGTLAAMAPDLAKGGSVVKLVEGQPFQLVMVPIRAPVTIGWIAMGFPLDAPVLEQLHTITGLDATLHVRTSGAPPQLLASTLTASAAQVLAALPDAQLEAQIDNSPQLVQELQVVASDAGKLLLHLSGPLARATQPFEALQLWLLAITVGAVALSALLSVVMARYVTRPLDGLMWAADNLRRGEYDRPLQVVQRHDEFGELADAFERMRQGIRGEIFFDQRLTQLPNRQYFRAELAKALAAERPVAVMLIGLNSFKQVNTQIGFTAGDRLLKAMAERLGTVVRPGDFVARLGGDVFAVLLPEGTVSRAMQAALRVGREIEQPLDLGGQQVDRQASIGIACAPDHANDVERLLARAEMAMYAAKQRKEAAMVYDPAFDTDSEQNLSLLSELRHACLNGELRLHLQPQVGLRDGAITGAEALLRWEHPQRGMVRPVDFIPQAEDTPLIRDLTLWVFEAVAKEQQALQALGLQRISINLSARDLMDLDLPAKLDTLLQRHGASAQGLCLETTESAVMGDITRARQTLARLAERGYQLSIDDFGTGHSSMEYLKELRVNELKIDMAFVRGIQSDPRNESIVRAMVDLGHALDLTVVAEGVENADIASRLAAIGCDEGQGWHYAKPMPPEALRTWLHNFQATRRGAETSTDN